MNKLTSGIYKIENKKTGQIYIGQSKDIETRFRRHCSVPPIDIAIANEGVDNFDFEILEEVHEDDLLEREKHWIQGYGAVENPYHYNCQIAGGEHLQYGYGIDGPNSKYTLWDSSVCDFSRHTMYREGRRKINPCACFSLRYKGYRVPIGMFYDFFSCEKIGELVDSFINN